MWNETKKGLLLDVDVQLITIVGDGRVDTPRFDAKYGMYTMLDIAQNKILDLEIFQRTVTPLLVKCNLISPSIK